MTSYSSSQYQRISTRGTRTRNRKRGKNIAKDIKEKRKKKVVIGRERERECGGAYFERKRVWLLYSNGEGEGS